MDPYKTPEAPIISHPTGTRSVGWKIYFFVITLVSLLGSLSFLLDANAGPVEYVSLVAVMVATAGLYGYAFSKPVYKPSFWWKFLVVYLGFNVAYYFATDIDLRMGMTDEEMIISNIIGLIVTFPAYYALYAYSKADGLAWRVTETDEP